jgi:NAD+ kinase
MSPKFKHAALIGKPNATGSREVLGEVAQFLWKQGLTVSLEEQTAAYTGLTPYDALTPQQMGERCDLAVVVGGDGTMLGIARQLARYGTPLVGINQGRLGFITDVPMIDFESTLGPMVAGEFVEEHRSMLEGAVHRRKESSDESGYEPIYEGYALNDVVISRGAATSMLELSISLADEPVANVRADGLIVASPTGSTAYALSAGGPILHPRIAGWVLVPIAPHDLSNRPIVVPDSGHVVVEVVAGRDASVNFDMHGLASLLPGDRVVVNRSRDQVRFLHPVEWSYYATLRRKLRWHSGGG